MDNSSTTFAAKTLTDKNTPQASWQRISPIALLYFLIKLLKELVGNFVYLLPALYIGYNHLIENPSFWLPITLAVIAVILLIVFLKFYFFKFRLHNNTIEIRSGVLAKKHINLPFSRIQNVKLEQPIYYRPFHYVCMALDTAGSHKQEAKVVALNIDFAEQLKKAILQTHQTAATNKDQQDIAEEKTVTTSNNTEKILNQRSLLDLVIHGMSNNRVWIFLGGLAPFFDNIANYIIHWLDNLGVNTEQLFSLTDKPWWQVSLYALTLTLMILLPITLFSILGAILSFYNFTLTKVNDRYIRRSGLLTKHEVTMKLSRLQMIIRQQDWLDKLLKRINLRFEQNQSLENKLDANAYNNKIIVPSITESQCQALIDDAYPDNQLKHITFTGISKRYLLRHIGYILLPIYLGLSCFFYLNDKSIMILLLTPIFILLSLVIFLRWRRWGFAIDNNYLYVQSGAIGLDQRIFPLYKIQQTRFKQSIFLRKHQLCHIRLILASGNVTIPYMKQAEGYNIIDNCLYIVEKSRRSWM